MTQPISVIAKSLVRERLRTGLSLAEIARRAGIAKSTLSQLESDLNGPLVASAHLVVEGQVPASEFEFGMILTWNAFSRWATSCMSAAGAPDLGMVDMAVPLSPDELIMKRHAIYRHLSQKDIMPFPGSDPREFWQRAEERTQNTAQLYDKLGMAEYQAIEVFVKMF